MIFTRNRETFRRWIASCLCSGGGALAMLMLATTATAQIVSQYRDLSPAQLYQQSFDTPSRVERRMMRGHLATVHPRTAEGKFAAAWIAWHDDRRSEAIRLAEDAIAQDPSLAVAYFSLCVYLEITGQLDRALEVCRRGLDVDPEYTSIIRNVYFLMRSGAPGPAAATNFLRAHEAEIGSAHPAFDFVRGIEQQLFGDPQQAMRYFESSVRKGGPFNALERLTNLRMQHDLAPGASVREQFNIISPVLEHAREHNDAEAYLYVATQLHERLNARADAFTIFEQAFRAHPMPEAVTGAVTAYRNHGFSEVLDFATRADRRFPNSYAIQEALGSLHSMNRLEPDRARRHFRAALDLAPTDNARESALAGLGNMLERLGQFDEALALYRGSIPDFSSEGERKVLGRIVLNRLAAQQFEDASAALERRRELGSINQSWYDVQRTRIDNALALETERRRFMDENPFLQQWERRFGESLTLSIEFAINSDVIPTSAYGALSDAAAALQSPGGERYVFMVEGHTDITGNDAINMPLSERRAASVMRHLRDRHGLDASRLRSAGHGPRHPIATNETEAGRNANRRVEIRPYGNISDPEVAVTTSLQAQRMALSPDGQFAAVGAYPVQIWDVRRGVKIQDLFRGADRTFSPNGRYVAAISNYTEVSGSVTNMLYIYDAKTGHAVAQQFIPNDIRRLAWSPFSDEVAFTTLDGFLGVYNIADRRLRTVGRTSDIQSGSVVAWLPDGDRIATGSSTGREIRLWDARDLAPAGVLDGVNWPHAMGATRDGQYFYAFDNDGMLSVWNLQDGSGPRQTRSPMTPVSVIAHPERPWVVLNDGFSRDGGGIAVVDLETLRVTARRDAPRRADIGLSPDGEMVFGAWGDDIHIMDIGTLRTVDRVTSQGPAGRSLAIDRGNELLISGDDVGNHVWRLTTGRKVHTMVTATDLGFHQLDPGGSRFVTVDEAGHLVRFDSSDFSETRLSKLDIQVTDIEVSRDYVVLLGRAPGLEATEQRAARVLVYDKAALQTDTSDVTPAATFGVPLLTADLQNPEFRGASVNVSAIDDGTGLIAFGSSWNDGFGRSTVYSRLALIYDLASGEQVQRITHDDEVRGLQFIGDEDNALRIDGRTAARVYDATTGNRLRWTPRPTTWMVTDSDGPEIEWSWDFVRVEDRRAFFPGTLRGVVADPDKNLIVGLTIENELVFLDIETLTRHLTIAAKADNEWIAYTPHGEFSASRRGTEGVFWSLGDNYLPFEALRERFESPQLVQRHLARLLERASPGDLPPVEIEPDLFEMPYSVSLASAETLETGDETYTLSLRIEILEEGVEAPQIAYSHNGRTIPRTRGFEEDVSFFDGEEETERANEVVVIERRFELDEGFNLIEASIVHRGARLETQRAEITRTVERPAPDDDAPIPPEIRPTTQLWYFGVGISEYEIENQNLNYAHRDALALEETFKAQEGELYSRVNTRVLVNEEATERNVRIELNDFLRQASSEDVIVIFVAGHGVRDSDQHLYLVTHDADMDRPFTGMSMSRFHDLLTARPINQKAVFMMDICHAGSFGPQRRGRVTIEDAVDQLADGTGTIVLASSTGAQSSFEDESFGGGHGAFTAALLEGLTGEADVAAGNADGFVSIQELMSFSARRVPEITEFRQHPTIPMMENLRDFPLTAARF